MALARGTERCARFWTRLEARRSLGNDLFRPNFFNRQHELASLDELLTPQSVDNAGCILLLTGPKDSGKSALLREFVRRQRAGTYTGVPVLADLRERSNMNPDEFATNLTRSFYSSLTRRVSVDATIFKDITNLKVDSNGVELKTPFEALRFNYHEQLGLNRVMQFFESYLSIIPKVGKGFHAAFPTFIIDEANALASWENEKDVETLLRYLVRVSKQESAANVVLASSENFFKNWLCGSPAFRGHDVHMATVGHLTEQEAKAYLMSLLPETLEGAVLAFWDDVFVHLGGDILYLRRFAKVAIKAGPSSVKEKWHYLKIALLLQARRFVQSGFFPMSLSVTQRGRDPEWSADHWEAAIKHFADARDGVVSYFSLLKELPESAVNSMILYDLIHYREHSGWDGDLIDVPNELWPIVMPNKRLQHLVMKQLAR